MAAKRQDPLARGGICVHPPNQLTNAELALAKQVEVVTVSMYLVMMEHQLELRNAAPWSRPGDKVQGRDTLTLGSTSTFPGAGVEQLASHEH